MALVNRYKVRANCLTAETRHTGRSWEETGLAIRRVVPLTRPASSRPRSSLGGVRYIGHHEKASAAMVITSEGVLFGMGASRKRDVSRWSSESLAEACGLPWDMLARPRAASTRGERHRVVFAEDSVPAGLRCVPLSEQLHAPREQSRCTAKAGAARYGASVQRAECVSVMLMGSIRVACMQVCRDRMLQRSAPHVAGPGSAASRFSAGCRSARRSAASWRHRRQSARASISAGSRSGGSRPQAKSRP